MAHAVQATTDRRKYQVSLTRGCAREGGVTELPPDISLARPEQDGKLLHAIVLCDDRTIVDSLEGLLTQLPLR